MATSLNDILRTIYQQATGLSGLALNDLELAFLRMVTGLSGLTINDLWYVLMGRVPSAQDKLNYIYNNILPRGHVFIVDDDGMPLVDDDGAYLTEAA
jgi:hypothetical protein